MEFTSEDPRGGQEIGGSAPCPVGPSSTSRPTSFAYISPYTLKPSENTIDWEFRAASFCSHQKPLGSPFRHPAGGGIHHRWPSSSSRRYPWRGGSSSTSGLRVCTSSYVFDLSLSCSLSCSLYGTILMYPELCYCSWILWMFLPLYSLVMNWVSPLKLSYWIESFMRTLDVCLAVLICGDNAISCASWCMFWWPTCGFRPWTYA